MWVAADVKISTGSIKIKSIRGWSACALGIRCHGHEMADVCRKIN